jgi:hypothetical protein
VRNARPKKAVLADPQIAEELLQRPHPWLDARPDAESLLEEIPLNILSRRERAEVLAAVVKAANKSMSLEDQIDEYVRAGRQALEKIQYLSACDRHRIETGLWLEKEKENVRDYPPDVRATIGRMLAEAAALFTTIGIPDCAEELLHRRKASAGGRNKPLKEWRAWVDGKLGKYVSRDPEISGRAAERKLKGEEAKPKDLPSGDDSLRPYVRTALPQIKAKLRLVPPG